MGTTWKHNKLYSLERRQERFKIIHVWFILEKLVPNLDSNEVNRRGIYSCQHIRHGRKFAVRGTYQKLISSSFYFRGPKLFNCLPKHLRNLSGCSKDFFKNNLDKFLSTLPDEPQLANYTICRRADSNSIPDMMEALVFTRWVYDDFIRRNKVSK